MGLITPSWEDLAALPKALMAFVIDGRLERIHELDRQREKYATDLQQAHALGSRAPFKVEV